MQRPTLPLQPPADHSHGTGHLRQRRSPAPADPHLNALLNESEELYSRPTEGEMIREVITVLRDGEVAAHAPRQSTTKNERRRGITESLVALLPYRSHDFPPHALENRPSHQSKGKARRRHTLTDAVLGG